MNATGRITEARKLIDAARLDGLSVGFVPTMGALHDGHRSLVGRARAENGFVVVSIFVNPAQFNAAGDLASYPRTFAADLEACADEGADLVFHPDADEMYPVAPVTSVAVSGLTESMEGAARPGHFAGVTLVCAKLFNIVGPCTAYFGEKDAQQLRVVRRMATDLDMPVEIVACPTVREADGLAMSSRNVRLGPDDRAAALALPRALGAVVEAARTGERDARVLERLGRDALEDLDVDYLEVVDASSLERLERADRPALVCAAVTVNGVRLIDNMAVDITEED
ncbi:MAG TPA: pantoate--beta-alanine ligase [Actinomycetota bacterium]|jgi:pantoate--beta-alanine ligase|nr:pantoate--beta-alanine ligase [Actinomycetota bacterium]